MKKLKTFTIICLLGVALNATSYAQTDNGTGKVKYNTWSVTLSGGSMLFYGDLKQFDFYPISAENGKEWYGFTKDISERKMGFGLAVTKQISPIFGVQGELQKGKLGGVKTSVDAYFIADVLKYGINFTVNFTNMFFPNCKNHFISFYGIAGMGYLNFKTVAKTISTDAEIMSYGYGNYGQDNEKTTELAIPLGLGLKYKLSPKFDLGIECTLNNINTDKLDAYVRANTAKDKYSYTAITLTYKIGKNEKSLEWVTPKEMDSDNLIPLFTTINKKVDSLGGKLNEVTNKVNNIEGRVTHLEKDVADLKNPPKEADDDNDGVPNSKDLEPNTPKGNLVNFQGITIPKCVNTTTNTTVIEKTEATYKFEVGEKIVLNNIFFDFNKATLRPESYTELNRLVKQLKDMPTVKIEISGHTDNIGSAAYNKTLSESRAKSVVNYLLQNGIDKSRLTYVGYGFDQPIASNSTDEGRQKNRRTEFKVLSK
jgi:OOP family OmpA-OmpF porin